MCMYVRGVGYMCVCVCVNIFFFIVTTSSVKSVFSRVEKQCNKIIAVHKGSLVLAALLHGGVCIKQEVMILLCGVYIFFFFILSKAYTVA